MTAAIQCSIEEQPRPSNKDTTNTGINNTTSDNTATNNTTSNNNDDDDTANMEAVHLVDHLCPFKGASVRRMALSSFLCTLILSVVLAVVVLLGPGMNGEWKILGTSLVIMAASLFVVACTPAMMIPHNNNNNNNTNSSSKKERFYVHLSWMAMASILVTTMLAIIAIWKDDIDSEVYFKTLFSFGVLALVCTYNCMMSGCYHANQWLVVAADSCFTLTLFLIWIGVMTTSDQGWQFVASLAVVSTGLTVGVPVVHMFNAWGSTTVLTTTVPPEPLTSSLPNDDDNDDAQEVVSSSVVWSEQVQVVLGQDGTTTKVIQKVETFPGGQTQTTIFHVQNEEQVVIEKGDTSTTCIIEDQKVKDDVVLDNSNNV